MRTSHKHTHTQPRAGRRSVWLRLLVLTLLVIGIIAGVARWGLRSAAADQLESARARFSEAKAKYLAHPSKENDDVYKAALAAYRAAATANPTAAATAQIDNTPYFSEAVNFAISPEARSIDPNVPLPQSSRVREKKIGATNKTIRTRVQTSNGSAAIQSAIPPSQSAVTPPTVNFEGPDMDTGAPLFGGRFAPNDPNADVGPNHIVVTTNGGMRVYDKAGNPLTAQFRMSQLMPGVPAAAEDDGDPVVLYDPLADRWLVSQFGLTLTNNSTHEIVAISRTGDPAGSYYVYDFLLAPGRVGDYPHLGVWPDGYYMSTNDFNTSLTAFLGAGFYALERDKMLVGDPTAKIIGFGTGPTDGGMLPTDIDGVQSPPVGTPNLFVEFFADEFGAPFTDSIRVFEFRPNFANPAASTVTQLPNIPTAAFDARSPASRAVIDQPAPATAADSLDGISDRLMHRLAYRTLAGGVQSYVMNWTVNVSGVNPTNSATYQGGVRWTELRRNSGTGAITINQQSTYAPGPIDGATGRNLWMASVAQDGEGNIGLAANASSTTLIPTVIYTGRLAGDPANTLTQGEIDAMSAVTRGVQTGTGNRWGDYSSLSVDPSDECTFWGAFEYSDPPSGSFDWNTRVFNFKVNPTCVSPAKASIQGQATNTTAGGAPIPDVKVTATGGFLRQTNAAGNYAFTNGVAPGTYTVTCSKLGFTTVSGAVTVAAGGTATFNCAMAGVPVVNLASSAITAEDCAVDGKTDPGETVSVQFCFNNTGAASTTNAVATLAATGGVTNPTPASQSYGVITAGGAAVCRTFTFRVNPAQVCGANVVATLSLTDGAASLGAYNGAFQSGQFLLSATENFDGVTAPALPGGWTAANAIGPAPLWVTSTTTPDTAPNAAFVNDPDVISDKRLDSVLYNITTSQSRLVFRHNFNLEGGFDGGVLEASVNGAAFVDVTNAAVVGAFTAGNYSGTISTAFSNPIAGRAAWTGNSGAYITSTVQFGATLQGKSVRFRWRMGSDTTVAGVGWRIDTIQLFDGFACCAKITPVVTLNDPDHCTAPGNNLLGTIRATNPIGSTLTNGVITATLPGGLIGVDGCTATVAGNPVGTCSVSPSAITWTGSLAGNAPLTINFIAQVGGVNAGAQLCATTTGGFAGVGLNPVQTCIAVNCTSIGPGNVIPTVVPGDGASPPSDQKPGSVLFYNIYSSSSANPNRENTRISMTNVDPSRAAFVHIFFVDGATCSVADAFICLTANQTVSFLASDLDPGTTGYIVAVAVDRNGCPINFNYLIGDEYVKFESGHQANLGAESIPAVAGGFTACS
ncbi:MAG: carboxypeptidase regulatory-like domain-containing protein, partial [Blastocatellia bacterium]